MAPPLAEVRWLWEDWATVQFVQSAFDRTSTSTLTWSHYQGILPACPLPLPEFFSQLRNFEDEILWKAR
jgi:hypothetical protein